MTTLTRAALDARMEGVRLYREGHSLGMAASVTGIDKKSLQLFMARMGIPRRTRSEAAQLAVAAGRMIHHPTRNVVRHVLPGHCTRCEILVAEDDWFCGECHEELACGDAWDPGAEWDAMVEGANENPRR